MNESNEKLFCPYACNILVMNIWHYEYDDEGRQTSITQTENTKRKYVECLREKCAVFNRETGKCECKE